MNLRPYLKAKESHNIVINDQQVCKLLFHLMFQLKPLQLSLDPGLQLTMPQGESYFEFLSA